MEKRRYSARAEVGASAPLQRGRYAPGLLDRAIDLTRLNWEVLAFVTLMALAVFTRLWELGPRAMHHDESIHAYFSNYFLKSGDYTVDYAAEQIAANPALRGTGGGYDPTYHGPFLYHITALSYYLFGTTEATSRLMPAIFGIILVGLCWLLRPFIGRVGALLAAGLVVLSPSITYYSRSLRHDIFALAGTMLLFVSILWFVRTHQPKWVYLGALGLAVAYTSHELTFIVAFIFLLFLVLGALLFKTFAYRTRYEDNRTVPDDTNPVQAAWQALTRQKWTLIGALLVFFGIYALLFTSLFTKPQLIFSGIVEGFNYWFFQHGEARGNQPWFYYLFLMVIYEPLVFLAGLGTVVYMIAKGVTGWPDRLAHSDETEVETEGAVDRYGVALPVTDSVRGFTLAFLAFWSFAALVAFSWAGEKMPWLNMQVALPFTLLASAGLGRMLSRMEWKQVLRGGGIFLGVAVILFIFSVFALIAHLMGTMPAPAGTSAELQRGIRGVLLFLVSIGLMGLSGWLAYKLMPGRAVRTVGLTFAVLLAAYGLRSMVLANWRHGDTPVEVLVYTQSSPDVPVVADLIKRLSRDETAFEGRNATDVTGGRSLEISIDQTESITWPFDWYFRDMKNYKYFNADQWKQNQTNIVSPNVPVILASDETENNANFQNFIKDKYTTQAYVLNWWFPEQAYKKAVQVQENGQTVTREVGDLGTAWQWLMGNGMKYFLYRNPGLPLGSRNFHLHVRNDLAAKAGLGAPTGVQAVTPSTPANPQPNPEGPEYGMFELRPAGVDKGQFNLPRGLARDTAGNFYVVDTANMRMQKFDPAGKWLAIIGSGRGSGDGQFVPYQGDSGDVVGTGPSGVAVDGDGNIYVADTWNHRVQKFDSSGKFLAKWGEFLSLGDASAANDPNRDSKFYGPRGIAVGPDGNVYVTDTGNKRVLIFDRNGKFVRKIDSGMDPQKVTSNYPFSNPGELNEPIGVAVDGTGNVYVADTFNKRVQKFDSAGKPAGVWAIPGAGWDPGQYPEPFLAVDGTGNLYATAPTGQKVLKFGPDGQVVAEKASEGAVTLRTPTGITIGPDGTLYVVDTTQHGVINLGKMATP